LLTACIFSVLLTGCKKDPVSDDLVNYINNDLAGISSIEQKALTEFRNLTQSSGTDSNVIYDTLKQSIIPTYSDFKTKLEAIKPKTEEVTELHNLYVSAAAKYYDAFTQYLSALENDPGLINQVNTKITEAGKDIADFQTKLKELADQHNVKFK
jgi:DNA repair ATPase RecN